MPKRYIKFGQFGKSLKYEENAGSGTAPAFETDGIVTFSGTVIISPSSTLIGGAWHPVVTYDEDNYVRRMFNSNLDGDWYLSFVNQGVETHRIGEFGLQMIGVSTELHYPVQEVITARDSRNGELEYDESNQIWRIGVPENNIPGADTIKVAEFDSSGHTRAYIFTEVGDRWRGSEGPLFTGMPYGWDPLPSINATCLTADLVHTHACFERVTFAGAVNAELKVKEISEGANFS